FNLPFDLSRLAADCGEARGRYRGGFSFPLWEYRDPRDAGTYRERTRRPRLDIKHLDSRRAFIGFARQWQPEGGRGERVPRGRFLDLKTLTLALTGKSHSLASACTAYGVIHGKQATGRHGVI